MMLAYMVTLLKYGSTSLLCDGVGKTAFSPEVSQAGPSGGPRAQFARRLAMAIWLMYCAPLAALVACGFDRFVGLSSAR
jgi:hypothetical protein